MLRPKPDRLFARFRERGDPAALAKVFDLTAPKLLQVARHLVRDRAEAEDLVQATFVTAIERARQYDPGRELVPWLVGILGRLAANARRRAERDADGERIARGLGRSEASAPMLALEHAELEAAVGRAVASLPDVYRPVLTAYLGEEMTPEQIARSLSRTPTTVRVQIHRGLKLLRRALPAGFTGAALVSTSSASLAAMKAAVLKHAAGAGALAPLAGSSATAATVALGVGAMTKNLVAAAAASLALCGALWFWQVEQGQGSARPVSVAPQADARVAAEPPRELRGEGGDAPETSSAPEPARSGERSLATAEPARGELFPSTVGGPISVVVTLLDRDSREPIADCPVQLSTRANEEPWTLVATAHSDPVGRVRFGGVPRQSLWLAIRPDGYVTASRVAREPGADEAFDYGTATLDYGTIELSRGGRLAGRVFDERSGAGVADAPIFVLNRFYGGEPGEPRSQTAWAAGTTQADGRYHLAERMFFQGAGSFEYVVFSVCPAGMAWRRAPLLEGADDPLIVELAVRGGAELELQVVDEGGNPVSGVDVRVQPRFEPFDQLGPIGSKWIGAGSALDALTRRASDAGGRARFENLPLWDERESRGPQQGSNPYDVHLALEGAQVLHEVQLVPGSNRVQLALVGPPARTLSGRVVDLAGRGIPGADVRVGQLTATTRAGGAFWLEGIPRTAAQPDVHVSAQGYASCSRKLSFDDELAVTDVELALAAQAPVAGVVRDAQGAPVGGAKCYLSRAPDHVQAQLMRMATAGADGAFVFDDAGAGRWNLNVWPPGELDEWAGIRSLQVDGGDEEIAITLERRPPGRAELVGRLFDAVTRRALQPEFARLFVLEEPTSGRPVSVAPMPRLTEEGARAHALRPGAYRLWMQAAEGGAAHADFVVGEETEQVEVRVETGAPARLEGRVALTSEMRAEHARVSLELDRSAASLPFGEEWRLDGSARELLELAEDGSFRADGMLPGEYVVRLHHFAAIALERVRLQSGETATVLVRPEAAAKLHFEGAAPCEAGFVWIDARCPDGYRERGYAQLEAGRFRTTLLVRPGDIAWEARLHEDRSGPGRAPRSLEGGELHVGARGERRVVLAFE